MQHGPFTACLDIQDPRDRQSKLNAIEERRMAEENPSLRMEEACKLIPQELQQLQGYHRGCYQKFTKNLSRLLSSAPFEDTPSTSLGQKRRSLRPNTIEKFIFNPDCTFCNKEGRIHVTHAGSRTTMTQGTVSFERDGWQRVLQ